MADLKISELDPLAGSSLAANDALAIVDVSASETKKILSKDLIQAGIQLIDDGSIPSTKFDFDLPGGSIGTAELADGSVTAQKLADQSSGIYDSALPATGAFVGQIAVNATDNKAYIWSGSAWATFMGSAGLNTLTVIDNDSPVELSVAVTDDNTNIQVALEPTTSAGQFLAGPAATSGDVVQRRIVGIDLPTASTTEKGGVVVNGNGLTMVGDTIAIDNNVTASTTFQVVTYDAYGLVTDGRSITGADLPPATDTDLGVIRPGPDLTVDVGGILTHSNVVPAGTGVKVSYDGNGHITGTAALEPEDLPEIPAGNITGEIGTDQLAECSVTSPKICDYATCLMQEDNPGAGDFLGQFWYTPSTAQLRVYSRGSGPENIWLPVGFGALQANNLRWGGTYDADTDTIVSLTSIGVSEGLTAGQAFPAASDALSGIYFVCQIAGNNCSQPSINGVNHTSGDWALCIDAAQGWVHIDANSGGGGGGGGAQYLNDLLDVQIGGASSPFSTSPAVTLSSDQLLRYDGGAGIWRNTDIIDGGSID